MKSKFILRLDTSKKGIEAVFKPWQIEAVNILLEDNEEHSSNQMHLKLRAREHDISRASVINFLQGLTELGLVMRREQSAKGGYRGIYKIAETKAQFNYKIINIFGQKMYGAFPDNEWLKDIWGEEGA